MPDSSGLAVLAAPSRLLAASWLLWPVVSAGLYSLGDRRETVLTYGLAAVMAAQLLAYLWIVFRGRGSALWGFGFSGAMLAAVILDNDLGWWAYVVFGLGVLGVWCGAPLLGSAWLMAAMHPQAWMPAGGVVWLVLGFALARVVPVFGVVALPALLLPVVAHLHLAWVCGGAERSVEPS